MRDDVDEINRIIDVGDPEAVALIMALLDTAPVDDFADVFIGAGPLTELLSEHGSVIAAAIAEQADSHPRLAVALLAVPPASLSRRTRRPLGARLRPIDL